MLMACLSGRPAKEGPPALPAGDKVNLSSMSIFPVIPGARRSRALTGCRNQPLSPAAGRRIYREE